MLKDLAESIEVLNRSLWSYNGWAHELDDKVKDTLEKTIEKYNLAVDATILQSKGVAPIDLSTVEKPTTNVQYYKEDSSQAEEGIIKKYKLSRDLIISLKALRYQFSRSADIDHLDRVLKGIIETFNKIEEEIEEC